MPFPGSTMPQIASSVSGCLPHPLRNRTLCGDPDGAESPSQSKATCRDRLPKFLKILAGHHRDEEREFDLRVLR
jgi:hypothetical protein